MDKDFDQIDSKPSELMSLIVLVAENHSSSRYASQSTITNARLIVYNCKKETQKCENAVEKRSINQLRKRETPVITYTSLKLYSFIPSKAVPQKLH